MPHPLHATERIWTETNCYVDVWIEVLHALGLDPVAAAAFTLSCDFEGDQWTFFKYPPEDLRGLYGIEVAELNVWRPVVDHVGEQLALGRLCTVEVDAWFLPDTRGVSYRVEHVKTTIVPTRLDRAGRRLDYFHNAGLFTLDRRRFRRRLPPRRARGPGGAAALCRDRPDRPDAPRGPRPGGPRGGPGPGPSRPQAGRTTRSPGWRPGSRPTCRGWRTRAWTRSTSTPSGCAVSAVPAPNWPPPSSTG